MSNNKGTKTISKKNDSNILENNNNVNDNPDSNINSMENNEVLDNLIKLSGNQEVYKELKEETSKIKLLLSQSKEKLANITLYEKQKSDIDIYQWNNLFNRSIPITSYVASSSYIKKQNKKLKQQEEENKNASSDKKETKEEKNKSTDIKHPIVLVDLTNEEMKKYLPPEPAGIPHSTNVIRFQQFPFRGDSSNVFYFSNAFNDYYKMDFKQFIQRMPVLKAKKRCESAKLYRQIKETKKKNKEEEIQKEYIKNQMLNGLNNLYIEKQYLSLSKNANNIQPLMSSIHAQIYPGKGDELTKHNKLYFKSNKPLGSERDIDNIDYSVNERDYQRNELQRIKGLKYNNSFKERPKSNMKRRLQLSRYNIDDPDIAIFKRIESLEKNGNEDVVNINDQKFINENNQEQLFFDSDRKIMSEENKEFDSFNKYIKENIDNERMKQIINRENLPIYNEIKNNTMKASDYKLIQKNIKANNNNTKSRALSAKRYYKREEILNNRNQNKFKRAMSAQGLRINNRNQKPFIHKVYLSSKSRIYNSAFHKNLLNNRQRNKYSNDLYDEKNKGNSSSQISTYEGINSSKYENQNAQRYAFPLKNNHQIENKIYQKINKRLKERQFEKYKQKLEEFSRLIRLDDAILSDDLSKDKIDNSNIYGNNNGTSGFLYSEKNKKYSRPLSCYIKNPGRNIPNNPRNNIINNNKKPLTPKLLRYNKNNFRAVSKKSSNENSKLDFTSSVLNTKHELMFNNNNDKVTLIYFNNIIENKPQQLNESKPVIKNDRIIVAANYFNRSKPQMLSYKSNSKNRRNLRRVKSSKNSSSLPEMKDNIIIQEE